MSADSLIPVDRSRGLVDISSAMTTNTIRVLRVVVSCVSVHLRGLFVKQEIYKNRVEQFDTFFTLQSWIRPGWIGEIRSRTGSSFGLLASRSALLIGSSLHQTSLDQH
jgi:hypothetical protein